MNTSMVFFFLKFWCTKNTQISAMVSIDPFVIMYIKALYYHSLLQKGFILNRLHEHQYGFFFQVLMNKK